MRFLFKLISRLFALVMLIFALLYAYGEYLYNEAMEKQAAQDIEVQSGNGFGGEVGMRIIDSDYSPRKFFWLDDDLLLFTTVRTPSIAGQNQDTYIWDTRKKEVLPVEIDGIADCIAHGHLYYRKLLNPDRPKGARTEFDTFKSDLVRKEDGWAVKGSKDIQEIWPNTPERHLLLWRGGSQCKPWYGLPNENRLPLDVPRHHFNYLSEWGWVLRAPLDDEQPAPEMGFFSIGDALYSGQDGVKIADPANIPPNYQASLKTNYIQFLGQYWVAIRLYTNAKKPKFMGLLNRNGNLRKVEWPSNWVLYNEIPLPTRKGIFWSAYDYRVSNPGLKHRGGFIRTENNMIHKVIHGAVERMELSPDGCKLAFLSRLKHYGSDNSSLRIFDACNSSIQGRKMNDVQY